MAGVAINRRLLLLAPFGFAAAGGIAFYAMLERMQRGTFDPHDIGNPMLNKPMPAFDMPGFSSKDVMAATQSKPLLLNFFASWCIPCAAEAPVVNAVAQGGMPVWGICYEDKPEKMQGFLDQYGNPYGKIAQDVHGRTAIDFGLYGVPESYLIDRAGIIRWHLAGPLTDEAVTQGLLPAVKAAA
jgi:cytochrome c biogenesis protein CcmG/thiol:disulfide interchange protein DsbE